MYLLYTSVSQRKNTSMSLVLNPCLELYSSPSSEGSSLPPVPLPLRPSPQSPLPHHPFLLPSFPFLLSSSPDRPPHHGHCSDESMTHSAATPTAYLFSRFRFLLSTLSLRVPLSRIGMGEREPKPWPYCPCHTFNFRILALNMATRGLLTFSHSILLIVLWRTSAHAPLGQISLGRKFAKCRKVVKPKENIVNELSS